MAGHTLGDRHGCSGLSAALCAVVTAARVCAPESEPTLDGMNRLASETSPYLRQHADNPVDWYPWGDEAFDRARSEDRPVLLVGRLLVVPLVPRDGPRVLRGRGDGRTS